MTFVVLLSATEMNDGFVNLKEKRRIKHTVTILVGVTILFALVVVIGIILAFELPPRNPQITVSKVALPQAADDWKHEIRAVFAINMVGPKDVRLRRSTENARRFITEVIRMLLIKYYNSGAQFAIQLYSVPGNTTLSDFCEAPCALEIVDKIDRKSTNSSVNPNQTDAILQYFRHTLGTDERSLYVLFVADRASYSDAGIFKKDMEDSSKALLDTELAKQTVTVTTNADVTDYFPDSIFSDRTSASETTSLINDRLSSYYRSEGASTLSSPQFSLLKPSIISDITFTTEDVNPSDVQDISSKEFIGPATVFHRIMGVLADTSGSMERTTPRSAQSSSSSESGTMAEEEEPFVETAPSSSTTKKSSSNSSSSTWKLPELKSQSSADAIGTITTRNVDAVVEMSSTTTVLPFQDDTTQIVAHHVISTELTKTIATTTTTTTIATTLVPFLWSGSTNSFGEEDAALGLVNELTQFDSSSVNPPFRTSSELSSTIDSKNNTQFSNSTSSEELPAQNIFDERIEGQNPEITKLSEKPLPVENDEPNTNEQAATFTGPTSSSSTTVSGTINPGLENMDYAEATGRASSFFVISTEKGPNFEENATTPWKTSTSDSGDEKIPDTTTEIAPSSFTGLSKAIESTILKSSFPVQEAMEFIPSMPQLTEQQYPSTALEEAPPKALEQTVSRVTTPVTYAGTGIPRESTKQVSVLSQKRPSPTLTPTVAAVGFAPTTFATENPGLVDFKNRLFATLRTAAGSPPSLSSLLSLFSSTDLPPSQSSLSTQSRTRTEVTDSSGTSAYNSENSVVSPQSITTEPVPSLETSPKLNTKTLAQQLTTSTEVTVTGGVSLDGFRPENTPAPSRTAIDDFAYSLEGFQTSTDMPDTLDHIDIDDFAYSLEDFSSYVPGTNKQNATIPPIVQPTLPPIGSSPTTDVSLQNMASFEKDFQAGYKLIDNMALGSSRTFDSGAVGKDSTAEPGTVTNLEVRQNVSEDAAADSENWMATESSSARTISTSSSSVGEILDRQASEERSNYYNITEPSVISISTPEASPRSIKGTVDTSTVRSPANPESLASVTSTRHFFIDFEQSFLTTNRLVPFAEIPRISTSTQQGTKEIFKNSGSTMSPVTAIPPTIASTDAAVFVGSFTNARNRGLIYTTNFLTSSSATTSTTASPDSRKTKTGGIIPGNTVPSVTTTQTPFAIEQEISSGANSTVSAKPHTGNSESSLLSPYAESSANTGPDITAWITDLVESFVPFPLANESEISTTVVSKFEDNLAPEFISITPLSPAVFNVTIPRSMLTADILAQINKTGNRYNYLLFDEVDYGEPHEPSEMLLASNDERPIILDKLQDDDTDTNLYSYEVTDTPLTSEDETDALELLKPLLRLKEQQRRQISEKITVAEDKRSPRANIFNIPSENAVENVRNTSSKASHIVSIIDFSRVTLPPGSAEDITAIAEMRDIGGFKQELQNKAEEVGSKTATTTVSPEVTVDPAKSRFITQVSGEIPNAQVVQDESRSSTVPSKPVMIRTNKPRPEIEETAPLRTNHLRKIHQTATILKAKIPFNIPNRAFFKTTGDSRITISKREDANTTAKPADEVLVGPKRRQVFVTPLRTSLETVDGGSGIKKFSHVMSAFRNETLFTPSTTGSMVMITELPQEDGNFPDTQNIQEESTSGTAEVLENSTVGRASQQIANSTNMPSQTDGASSLSFETYLSVRNTTDVTSSARIGDLGDNMSNKASPTRKIPQAEIFFSRDNRTLALAKETSLKSLVGSKSITGASRNSSAKEIVSESAEVEVKRQQPDQEYDDISLPLDDELDRLKVIGDNTEQVRRTGTQKALVSTFPVSSSREILDGSGDLD